MFIVGVKLVSKMLFLDFILKLNISSRAENVDYPDIMFGTRLRVETTYACANKLYSTGYDSKALFCGKNYKTKTCGKA